MDCKSVLGSMKSFGVSDVKLLQICRLIRAAFIDKIYGPTFSFNCI
jgi:hypothetical protein